MANQAKVSSDSRQASDGRSAACGCWQWVVIGSLVLSGASVAFGGGSRPTASGHEARGMGSGVVWTGSALSFAPHPVGYVVCQASSPPKPEPPEPKPGQPKNSSSQSGPTAPAGTGKDKSAPPVSPPKEGDGNPAAEAKPEGGKSLDELLGLPGSKPPAGGDGADETVSDPALAEAKRRLERGLNEAELDSLLRQALAGMESSAMRLGEATDTGLATQRVQEDVVAKLDQLIQEAKRRCKSGQSSSNGSSSGSSSSEGKKQAAGAKPGERGDQKPGESKTRSGSQRAKGDGNKEGEGPASVDPSDNQAALDESQAEWGALPDRVRDLIRQGSRDRIASIYQRLTQEYYRRMAEDASR